MPKFIDILVNGQHYRICDPQEYSDVQRDEQGRPLAPEDPRSDFVRIWVTHPKKISDDALVAAAERRWLEDSIAGLPRMLHARKLDPADPFGWGRDHLKVSDVCDAAPTPQDVRWVKEKVYRHTHERGHGG